MRGNEPHISWRRRIETQDPAITRGLVFSKLPGNLVRALVEHYEATDTETKRLVPLKQMYWPA